MGQRKLRTATLLRLSVVAVIFSVFGYGAISGSTVVAPVKVSVAPSAPLKVTTTTPHTILASSTTTPVVTTTTKPRPENAWSMSNLPHPTTTIEQAVTVSMETPIISELEALICDPKWKWSCSEAKAVARCESQVRPHAISPPNTNGTRDRGLFQVNSVWRDAFGETLWAQILEPEVNVAMAHHIWTVGNESWMYWTCQP